MAWSLVGAADNLNTGTNSISANKPTGTTAGDIMFSALAIAGIGSATVTPPAGFTAIEAPGNGTLAVLLAWKIAGSSEPASYTWTTSVPVTALVLINSTIRGQATSSPIADHQHTLSTTAASALPSPSVTAAAANSLWLSWIAFNGGATLSVPSGFSLADIRSGTGVGHAYKTVTSAGATGASPNWTTTAAASQPNVAISVALSPATTAGTATGSSFTAGGATATTAMHGTTAGASVTAGSAVATKFRFGTATASDVTSGAATATGAMTAAATGADTTSGSAVGTKFRFASATSSAATTGGATATVDIAAIATGASSTAGSATVVDTSSFDAPVPFDAAIPFDGTANEAQATGATGTAGGATASGDFAASAAGANSTAGSATGTIARAIAGTATGADVTAGVATGTVALVVLESFAIGLVLDPGVYVTGGSLEPVVQIAPIRAVSTGFDAAVPFDAVRLPFDGAALQAQATTADYALSRTGSAVEYDTSAIVAREEYVTS